MRDAALTRPALAAQLIALLAAAAPPTSAEAQRCSIEETVAECWTRLSTDSPNVNTANAATAAEVVDAAADSGADEVAAANAGVDTSAASTASATKNFIPLLRFAGLVGDGVTTDDGFIAFDVNFHFPAPGAGNRSQFQLIANPSPKLHPALNTALAALGDDALRNELENGLSDTDDLRVAFTYGKTGEALGRDFTHYRGMFASLVNAAFRDRADPDLERHGVVIVEAIATLSEQQSELVGEDGIDDVPFRAIADDAFRTKLMEDIAAAATQELATTESLETRLAKFRLEEFSKLVANQPQLYVKAEQRLGNDLVGPRETSVAVTWERGFASLTDFSRVAGAECGVAALAAARSAPPSCLEAFRDYVQAHVSDVDNGNRMALALEYNKVNGYSFSRPQNALDVTQPSAKKIAASYTFGRNVATDRADGQRIDFVVKYEKSDDSDVLNDRTIAGVTYSRKIGDSLFPVTILYSSKGELAGDDGDELTINFGMAFEMIK